MIFLLIVKKKNKTLLVTRETTSLYSILVLQLDFKTLDGSHFFPLKVL
jgi:hypothetical protein